MVRAKATDYESSDRVSSVWLKTQGYEVMQPIENSHKRASNTELVYSAVLGA